MTTVNLCLNSIEKVKLFVNIITQYDGDFDLASDRYIIDAKSIMGIFSLNLSEPLKLSIYNDQIANTVIEKLKEFMV